MSYDPSDESGGLDLSLPASASPGQDTLPAEGQPQGDMGPPAPAPVTDLSTQATPSLALAPAQPSAGLGLARPDADSEYLRNLPTQQKIGLMLEAFGSGVTGRPNPVTELLANRRKQEAEFRAELGTTLKTIEAGVQVIKSMPPGKARDALTEQISRAAGSQGMDPKIIASAFQAAGTNDAKDLQDIVGVLQDPAAQRLLIDAAMKAQDPRKEALRLISDSDFRKNLEKTADQNNLPKAMTAMNVFSKALKQMPGMVDANGNFSMATLIEQNAKAAPENKIPDAVIGTIQRNQSAFIPYGLKTDKAAEAQQESDARNGAQFHSEAAKARADYAAGRITLDDLNNILKKRDNTVIIQQQAIEKGKGADASIPGGSGSEMLQDRDSGVKYSVNTKTGKAWKMGDDGEWAPVNPNTVPANATKVGAGAGGQAGREAVFTQRILQSAGQAASDLENVAKLPLTASTGVFGGRKQGTGLMDATKEVLANTVTSQEAQSYAVKATGFQRNLASIEAAGLMPSGALTHQLDAVIWKEGDTNLTKLQKLAQTRQIIDSGLETMAANPRISDQEKQKMKDVQDKVAAAVPFTHADLDRLQAAQEKNPNATLKDVLLKAGTVKGGYRFKGGDPADKANWEKVQ